MYANIVIPSGSQCSQYVSLSFSYSQRIVLFHEYMGSPPPPPVYFCLLYISILFIHLIIVVVVVHLIVVVVVNLWGGGGGGGVAHRILESYRYCRSIRSAGPCLF